MEGTGCYPRTKNCPLSVDALFQPLQPTQAVNTADVKRFLPFESDGPQYIRICYHLSPGPERSPGHAAKKTPFLHLKPETQAHGVCHLEPDLTRSCLKSKVVEATRRPFRAPLYE